MPDWLHVVRWSAIWLAALMLLAWIIFPEVGDAGR